MEKNKNSKEHWENVYQTKAENEVSWFQPYPKTSIAFLESFHLPLDANIIDMGGGNSHLVDALLEKGYQNIWVLDIAAKAIEKAKQRLGEKGNRVHWIVSDVTKFIAPVQFDCWHDRATFHFFTSEEKISQYVSIAEKAIKQNGRLIISTFSEQGPKKCSGLHIKQYSEIAMAKRFENAFEKINCIQEDHITPLNTAQHFLFCIFKRK